MAGQKKHQVAVIGSGNWYDLLYKYKLFKTTIAQDRGLVTEAWVIIEIGPHSIYLGMIRDVLGDPHLKLPTLRRKDGPWKVIARGLASLHDQGFSINWSEYHRDFDHTHRLPTLPAYAFDNKRY